MFGSALVLSAALVAGGTELDKAEQAGPLTGAASGSAVLGVAMIFLAGRGVVTDGLCMHQLAPSDGESDSGPGCWSMNGLVFTPLIVAPSVMTLVLAAVAGDRWGIRQRLERHRITPKAARGAIAAGILMRLAGLGLIVGSTSLLSQAHACSDVSDDAFHRCLNGNAYGAAAMASSGALLRWSGAGLMTFGFRHRRNQRAALSLSPSLMGFSGRF